MVLIEPGNDGFTVAQLRQLDRTSLQPVPGIDPVALTPCAGIEVPRGSTSLGVSLVDSRLVAPGQCEEADALSVRFLDLLHLRWRAEVKLTDAETPFTSRAWSPLGARPMVVSPDGKTLYLLTTTRGTQPVTRLWIVGVGGRDAPVSTVLPYQAWRMDVASSREAACLVEDQNPLQVLQSGDDRLYVVVPSADAQATPASISSADVIAYDVGTWRVLSRITVPGSGPLVGSAGLGY